VIVLRLGKRVGTFEVKNTTPEQVVAAITGAEFGKLTEAPSAGNSSSDNAGGK
jgi:ABC-type sugar transport system ATPase subunit